MDTADDDRERAMLAAYLRRASADNIDSLINDHHCPHCGQPMRRNAANVSDPDLS